MKYLIVIVPLLSMAHMAQAECLAMDSLAVIPAVCASGTCSTGPGVVGGAEFKAMLFPSFQVIAHNACKTKQPVKSDAWNVEVAFYDKDDFRLGLGTFSVSWLGPREKVKHTFEIPEDVRVNGLVASVKVRAITEAATIPGQEHR